MRAFVKIGIFIMSIALISYPVNEIFLVILPLSVAGILMNTVWWGLILVVVWHYRQEIRSYFK